MTREAQSYPSPAEVREMLKNTAPGTVIWEGALIRKGKLDLAIQCLVEWDGDGLIEWPMFGGFDVVGDSDGVFARWALSRHGLCPPPPGVVEVPT